MTQPSTNHKVRSATRWKYQVSITLGFDDGSKAKGSLLSISKSGIGFTSDEDLRSATKLFVGWKDPELGLIRGSFIIKSKKCTSDNAHWLYGARYYQVDPESKKNLLQLFQNLQSLKSEAKTLNIDVIRKTIESDVGIFRQFQSSDADFDSSTRSVLDNISPTAFQLCISPKDTFEQGYQQMQKCFLHLSLIYAYIHNSQILSAANFSFCLTHLEKIFDQYLTLESQDLGALDLTAYTEDDFQELGDKEVKLRIKKQEATNNLKKTYVSLVNNFFNVSKSLVQSFDTIGWQPKLKDPEPEKVNDLEQHVQKITTFFQEMMTVEAEHISDIDMLLTRSSYEIDQNPKNAEVKNSSNHRASSAAYYKRVGLMGLVLLLLFGNWVYMNWPDNQASDFRDPLNLPIKVKKVYPKNNTLLVHVDQSAFFPRDEETIDLVKDRIEEYFEQQSKYSVVILLGKKKKALLMWARKI